MRIPKKITIGAITYTVHKNKELPGLHGKLEEKNSTIHICSTVIRPQQELTFVHECLHACYPALPEDELGMLAILMYQVICQIS